MLALMPLTDPQAIRALHDDPYIARIGHDHRPSSPVLHPAADYIGAYVAGRLLGAFLVIRSGFIERDVHALLTRQALPHSRTLGRMLLAQLFGDASLQRVTAYVIEGLESARNYCRKLGFKDEGMRRACCMRNGELVGVYTMGLTRNDWEDNK